MDSSEREPHCKHFVIRKKRFCRMTLKVGEEYCGEHKPQVESTEISKDEWKRVTCPLDPKHTCYASKLKQHLKKCNAKPSVQLLYIEKNVNAGECIELDQVQKRLLSNVTVARQLDVIAKVTKVHKDIIRRENIVEHICSHSVLDTEIANPEYGHTTKKHLLQTSSILGLMKECNFLLPDTCYVEFGAGKGKLSYWISKAVEELGYTTSSVLLVERASHRHKYDNKLDKTTGNVIRIRADIADLVLSNVDCVVRAKNVVGVTKHLCGDATDLALRCLANSKAAGKNVAGVVMAFCCHHRCQWGSYCGKPSFDSVALSKEDFDVMCGMVSWAVCGTGQNRDKLQKSELPPELNPKDKELGLTREQKEEIGKQSKDVLNWGRKTYLESLGFKSHLCYYVSSEISLENVCVVGVGQII